MPYSNTQDALAYARKRNKRPDVALKRRIYNRIYRSKNPEKVRLWYRTCRKNGTHSSVNGKNLEWYHCNREKAKVLHRNWCRLNRSRINQYELLKCRNNPEWKIRKRMSARLGEIIRVFTGKRKAVKTELLLGCSRNVLIQWMESQFVDGMNWENYGQFGWHIDHIRPCSSFDLSRPKQQRACFHYTNLQPLWWRDNISKGGFKKTKQPLEEM